jgi:2-oxo-4-hydroxy-4-carboxy-5-ureidoimidazoline decarboxylase
MAEPHALLSSLPEAEAREALTRCCGAQRWVAGMLARRPYDDAAAMYRAAEESFRELARDDLLEAFSHHPRIGGDLAALRARFGSSASWAAEEQGATLTATEETLEALRGANLQYEARFGHIFIVCASGKSAAEMLHSLRERLANSPERELAIAAEEQASITRLRLEKLAQPSKLTTHVLDTARGRPAANLRVRLEQLAASGVFEPISERTTDADGRVRDLLAGRALEARSYRLVFETEPYFAADERPTFYPRVEICFRVNSPEEHHHVPLLLSPFGYSTYRGS